MLTPFGEIPDRLARHMTMAEQHEYLRRRRPSRRAVLGSALAAVAGPTLLTGTARASVTTPAQVGPRYLAFGGDPARAMTVSFATPTRFGRALVRYGPVAETGEATDLGGTAEVELANVDRATTSYGHANLTALAPATAYRYRLSVDGAEGPEGTFTTAPDGPTPFTFTAFGDQDVTADAVAVLGQVAGAKPAFHLHAGDLCYAAGGSGLLTESFSIRRWDRWLDQISPVASKVPWMPAVGNHEMEPGYDVNGYGGVLGRLAVPAGGAPGCPATYAFRYGNVGFISLDSNDVSYEIPANFGYSAGSQLRWLEAILARYRRDRSGVDFIVVYFHHCAFSTSNAHGSEGGVRELWVPLFDRYAVDLVINGHNHSYERTLPLRAGRPVAGGAGEVDSTAGTTYVTAGGGGAVRTPGFGHVSGKSTIWQSDGRPYSEAVDWSMPTGADQYSVLIAEVAPGPAAGGETTMKLRAVGADGTVLDRVTLRRPARPHDPAAAQAEGGGDGVAPWAIGGAAALATVAAAGGGYAVHRHLATR